MKKKIIVFLLFSFVFLLHSGLVLADECNPSCSGIDECQRKIDECQKLINISVNSTKPHEQKINEIENDIDAINANVASLTLEISKKKKEIQLDEVRLDDSQKRLNAKIRDYYKKDYQSAVEYALGVILSNVDLGQAAQTIAYRQDLVNQEKRSITGIALDIIDLGNDKKKLEQSTEWLAAKRVNLEATLAPIKDLVKKAKDYQSKLTSTVGSLSSRQKELLAEKTGNFQTSVGDVPMADDPASRPDYNPGFSPAYAGFSFGAPHRKGMSQYGAFGRAKSGQNAEDILKGYYGGGIEIKKDYSTSIRITVQGYGSYDIEEYVKRIYEVPNSWGDQGGFEALKAQAVAARSYALAYTNNGSGSICATEACQVFQPGAKGGNWDRAVNETRGWVLQANGKPISAWYAASSGGYNYSYVTNGYTTSGGWDTKCGNQGCWTADAYEKIAGSPWFYKAWYKPRGSSASRSHPWLNKDEFADIVNCAILYTKDDGTLSHLGQTDKSNPDTWSRDEVRNRLGGDAISSVDSISVSYSTGGYTNSVKVNGRDIDGVKFRQIFNLRAPGEIWLASELYNFEKK